MGGQIGRMINRAPRPLANIGGSFAVVDTDDEIQKSIDGRNIPDVD